MKNSLLPSRGNAVLISIAITGFLFLAASGASKVILGSLRDSPKIVESSEALYAAESAMEAALYDAKNRGSGYTTDAGTQAGDSAYVGLSNINSSSGSWVVNSQTEATRTNFASDAIPDYQHTMFIPPRKVLAISPIIANENLSNWRKVRMGEKVQFNLYVDTNTTETPLQLGTGDAVAAPTDPGTLPLGVFLGPNGIRSDQTKSIMMGESNTHNSDIENVFIDLFIPATSLDDIGNDNPVLLSWQVEGRTDGTIQGLPSVVKVVSSSDCATIGTNAGIICYKHFDTDHADNIAKFTSDVLDNEGIWVRLNYPEGLLTLGGVDDPTITPLSITDFFSRLGRAPAELSNPIYFPRLILQIGQPVRGVSPLSGDLQTISEAYVRVGFTMDVSPADMPNVIGQNFPLPDDKVTINATGASGVVKKGVQAEIHPQEGAPMFDYSVFQP